jgi:hypothetical protein
VFRVSPCRILTIICHLSSATHLFHICWIGFLCFMFCVEPGDIQVCWDRVMRKHSIFEDSFGRTSLSVRIIVKFFCDLLRLRLTFVTSIFEDENFLLEGKNCKTQRF